MGFLAAIGIFLVLFGITALIIGAFRHFFPMLNDFIPKEFDKALSIQFSAYYLLAGLLLILIQPK
jgi:hypothetical protein